MISQKLKDLLIKESSDAAGKGQLIDFTNTVREFIHEKISPFRHHPVDFVRWAPIEEVQPNDYNPNSVARVEMGLLYRSIKHDGYTQPTVTIRDGEICKNVIVDGFHRYFTCKENADINTSTLGRLPIVKMEKDINERMAATVRHNRARGKHSITGMSNMVFEMLKNGMEDAAICNELGMEPEELLKLKHITGFSKLFENTEYSKAWETKDQIKIRLAFEKVKRAEDGE